MGHGRFVHKLAVRQPDQQHCARLLSGRWKAVATLLAARAQVGHRETTRKIPGHPLRMVRFQRTTLRLANVLRRRQREKDPWSFWGHSVAPPSPKVKLKTGVCFGPIFQVNIGIRTWRDALRRPDSACTAVSILALPAISFWSEATCRTPSFCEVGEAEDTRNPRSNRSQRRHSGAILSIGYCFRLKPHGKSRILPLERRHHCHRHAFVNTANLHLGAPSELVFGLGDELILFLQQRPLLHELQKCGERNGMGGKWGQAQSYLITTTLSAAAVGVACGVELLLLLLSSYLETCMVRAFLSFSSSETAVFCLSVIFSHSLRRCALART